MSTMFRGLHVPPGLTKEDVRKINMHHVCAAYSVDGIKCFSAGIPCDKCICWAENGEDLKKLLEMWEKEDMDNKMPELQFGDVVKYDDGPYGIVGIHDVHFLTNKDGIMSVTGVSRSNTDVRNIVKVFRSDSGEGFRQGELYRLYTGLAGGFVIWKKPDVREMTVDEISKELGYKVKVVGNE